MTDDFSFVREMLESVRLPDASLEEMERRRAERRAEFEEEMEDFDFKWGGGRKGENNQALPEGGANQD